MSRDAYELLALAARYVFAGLMVLIALRAARLTAIDSRRATKLRRLSPMTGLSGELVVLEGDGKVRRGMRYPVIREGIVGSSRRSDVYLKHSSVRRRHAIFQLTGEGLRLRDHAGARLYDSDGDAVRELTLRDGDSVWIGKIRLLLVLANATAAQSREAEEELFALSRDDEDDWAPRRENVHYNRKKSAPSRRDDRSELAREAQFDRMMRENAGGRRTGPVSDGIVSTGGQREVHRNPVRPRPTKETDFSENDNLFLEDDENW